ncbi:ABC transporter substrate-binding protein [Agromyces mediolanus]|uniref:ABC transporter substrate-binding protein n=1 Tax=Agromyces mediolanus TaxID=41986 RepID=UPI0020423933|nr:ABC transporter substrate-binding protein [Agromyces mediolanus]MCM3657333.1 ABC transporter substrate-binding protein [Agromyces mediolanus]
MRKTLSTAGAGAGAIAMVLALGACASGGDAAGDENVIVVQTNWTSSQAQNKPLFDAFDAFTEETGIEVKVLESGDNLNQVYETSLLAGEEADVLLVGLLEKQLDWAVNGAVVPVDDYIEEWGIADRIPADALVDWTDTEGNLRAFPYSGFTWPWWYNTELLAQAGVEGVPQTADELISAATKLRAAGIAPVVFGGIDWSGQKIFLQLLEAYLSEDEAKQVYAEGGVCENPKAMQGIELLIELRDAGVFVDGIEGYTADQAQAAYLDGQAAIAPLGSWAYPGASEELAAVTELGGLPLPADAAYEQPIAYRGSTSAGWWISPNGEQKIDQVRQLIEHMYGNEVIKGILDEGGVIPVADFGGDTSGVSAPLLAQSLTEFPERVEFPVMPDIYVPADVSNPMYRATSIAFTPGTDAQTICATVDEIYAAAQ